MMLFMRDNEMRAEGRKEGLKEGRKEGAVLSMWNLVQEGILTLSQAASNIGMTEEELKEKAALYLKS